MEVTSRLTQVVVVSGSVALVGGRTSGSPVAPNATRQWVTPGSQVGVRCEQLSPVPL